MECTALDTDKTRFSYAELSDTAKEHALEKARYQDTGYDWWDSTYEDAVAIGLLMGINIGTYTVRTTKARKYQNTAIFFSGFCSQGDGACFNGTYSHPATDIVKAVTKYAPQDAELKRIAEGLALIQVTARMMLSNFVAATITTNSSYSHSGAMDVSTSLYNFFDYDTTPCTITVENMERDLTQLLRDFADWIYDQLRAEDEYLHSDAYIVEGFNNSNTQFDEDGTIV